MVNSVSGKVVSVIVCLLVMLLNVGIYMYIRELEKEQCECSDKVLRDVVKYGSLVYVAYLVIFLLLNLLGNNVFNRLNILTILLFVLTLSYYICCVVLYFKLATNPNCDCSHDWKRKILVYPLVFAPLFVIALLSILYFLFSKVSRR